jgi:hypothetical protein
VLSLVASTAGPAAAASPLPPIKHVFTIVLENKSYDETFGFGSAAPYLSQTLPSMGALLPNYYGVTHQSLGNYIALVSGQGSNPLTQADCLLYINVTPAAVGADAQAGGLGCVYPRPVKTIAGQLTSAGLTWKGYMEDMGNAAGQPKTCRHPALGQLDGTQLARPGDQYAARHNPFVYFHSIIDTPACAQNDVPLDRLPADLSSAAATPSYSFITPDLCNDGHDAKCVGGAVGGLPRIDRFLRTWVPRILASAAYRAGGLLVITFDEAESGDASACCNEPQFPNTPNNGGTTLGRGGGRIGAVLLSPYIDPGTIDTVAYNHFTLLRSVEDLFGLGHLGFAGRPALRSLGPDAFTCYSGTHPHAVHGRLSAGSLIKLAVVARGAVRLPTLQTKLWDSGRLSVRVARLGARRASWGGAARRVGPCQLRRTRLPFAHGRLTISARGFGGVERRSISF